MFKRILLLSLAVAMMVAPTLADPAKASTATFTCPMHSEVTSSKAGSCPKCKMKLVEKAVYVCPMHPEVTADKPSKCGKCKMSLVKKTNGKPITK